MYSISDNTPSAGCIQWSGLHMQYLGVTYTITDGYTNYPYIYWNHNTPTQLVVSSTLPTLTDADCLLFLNKSGIHLTVPTATILDGDLLVPGSVMANALAANSVTANALSADCVTANALAANCIGAEAIASGAVTSDKIVSSAITSDKLAANSVTANAIVSGTITADKLAANTITSSSACIESLDASKITAGSLNADRISGGTLTLGGSGNGNGTAVINDGSGNAIINMNNTGIVVNQANYLMKESNGTLYAIGSYENLVADGSFESLIASGTFNSYYIDFDIVANNWWQILSGSPKLIYIGDDTASAPALGVKFGNCAVAASSANILKTQNILSNFIGYSATYTVSAYVSSHPNRNTQGSSVNAVLIVNLIDNSSGGTVVKTYSQTMNITNSHTQGSIDTTDRIALTFTTPSSSTYFDTVEIQLSSGSSTQWVVWDGIQMVAGSYPTVFLDVNRALIAGNVWADRLLGTTNNDIINLGSEAGNCNINTMSGSLRMEADTSDYIKVDPGGAGINFYINGTNPAYLNASYFYSSGINIGKTNEIWCSSGIGINYRGGSTAGIVVYNGSQTSTRGPISCSTVSCTGTKPALVTTEHYDEVYLFAEESPTPQFTDRGHGVVGNDGLCYIYLDDIFIETVTTNNCDYYIQLTGYTGSNAEIYDKQPGYFIVSGTAGKQFDWQVTCDRKGYERLRYNEAIVEM